MTSSRGNEGRNGLGQASSRDNSRPRHGGRRQPRLETLESRQLLSVAPYGARPEDAWVAPDSFQTESNQLPFHVPAQTTLQGDFGAFLSGPAAGDPLDIALDYLRDNARRLGLTQEVVNAAVVTDRYTSQHNGVTHIYLAQTLDGLRVANATINVNVAADGSVLNVGSSFVGGLGARRTTVRETADLEPTRALAFAGEKLGLKGEITVDQADPTAPSTYQLRAPAYSRDPVRPKMIYVPRADGRVEPAWNMQLRTPDGRHWYNMAADSATGELVMASDWASDASYNVFPQPSESPQNIGRVILTDPHDNLASPFGWHDTDGATGAEFTDTRGNNVSAQEDSDANDSGGFRPDGGAGLVFDFPFNDAQDPSTYTSAAITNLFYWNNLLHDVHYHFGFNEVSGNFQVNNYGNGGLGGDPVQADAQDGSGTNNANMFTPPDGIPPRMQQFIFNCCSTPARDSSLANEIIVHEYGHGVSTRLTGGPANSDSLSALQSGGMGEGWSDWWALMFTQDPGDGKFDAYPQGNYVLGQPETGPGVRGEPYSFDMTINPHTLGDFNSSPEVHDAGEIWTSALWDMNWLLIDRYGYEPNLATGYQGPGSAGNLLAMQLVADGLKLQPANPTFTQARDAILLADQTLTGGTNAREIWTAFARRGFGLSADVDDGNGPNSFFVIEAFDVPIFDLHVTTTDPAVNSIIAGTPTSFTIDFSQEFDPGTVDADDFQVNGIAANGVTIIDTNTLQFSFNSSPVTAQGEQKMTMAAGALLRASDGDPSIAFEGSFRYDTLRMAVTGTTPFEGASVVLPLASIDVHLNEPVAAASVAASDLQMSQGIVTGVELVDADTVRFHVSGLSREGGLNFSLPAAAFADEWGNPSETYSGALVLDFGTVPFPGAIAPVQPFGGLAFEASATGIIGASGDTDTFTVELEAGQTLAAAVDADEGLAPSLMVTDPDGAIVLQGSAESGGEIALPAVQLDVQGVYSFTVSGTGVGGYRLRPVLNLALEAEEYGGPDNDSRANAQSLTSEFTSIGGTATRAAVAGQSPSVGDLPFEVEPNSSRTEANRLEGNFGAPLVDMYLQSIAGNQDDSADIDWFNLGPMQAGDVLTISLSASTTGRGTLGDPYLYLYRRNGGNPLLMAFSDDGGPGLDSLIYRFAVTEPDDYFAVVDDYGGSSTGTYQVGVQLENADAAPATGATVATDAESNNTVDSATNATASWQQVVRQSSTRGTFNGDDDWYRYDVTAGDVISVNVAGAPGLYQPTIEMYTSRGPTLALENGESVFGESPIFAYRTGFTGQLYLRVIGFGSGDYTSNVYLSSSNPPTVAVATPDYYSLDLESGETLTLALHADRPGLTQLALEDPDGNTLTIGVGTFDELDQVIRDFHVTQSGTYYAVVTGGVATDYRMVAVRDASFDIESNDLAALAQPVESRRVDGVQRVLGRISAGAPEIVRFTELPAQPVDGLSFNKVTYDFKVNGNDSTDAFFGGFGPGTTKYIDGLCIEGNASGELSFDFAVPTAKLEFGVALNSFGTFPNGVVVDLFDAGGQLIESRSVQTQDEGFFFSEALFAYSGAPVSRARLNFDETVAGRFVLDNLTYEVRTGVDLYPVTVVELGTLVLETETPGDDPGAPANALDPRLRLLDADGNVLAQNDNGAADGRNAHLEFTIPRGVHTYYVEVSPSDATEAPTKGDYVLRIANPTQAPAPFTASSLNPADGARLRFQPAGATIQFSEGVLLASLSADDLLIDGVPAASLEVLGGNQARFALPPGLSEGPHTLSIAEAGVTDLQGTGLAAFSSQFTLDFTAPRIVGSSLSSGDVAPAGTLDVAITFSEAISSASLTSDDVQLFGVTKNHFYSPATLALDATRTILNVSFAGLPEDNYTLTLFAGDQRFEDLVGINLDGEATAFPLPPNVTGDGAEGGDFTVSFATDVVTSPFAVPLKAAGPRGSLVYRGATAGILAPVDDVDEFTIQLDAGQSLTLTALGGSVQPHVELRDPQGTILASAFATTVGGEAVLRTARVNAAGEYVVSITGMNGSIGFYEVTAVLNADVELEHHGGGTNGGLASAQDVNFAFVPFADGASRAAVLGVADRPDGVLPVEAEPNNALDAANNASANFVTAPTQLYQIGISGSVTGLRGGNDWFALGAMGSGDILTISLSGIGSGRGTLSDGYLELWAGPDVANLQLVAENDDGGPGVDSLINQFFVPDNALYYVKARGLDSSVSGSYSLNIWLQNSGRSPGTFGSLTTESEPNDTAATADVASNAWRSVGYLATTQGSIGAADVDLFRYQFQAGDLVTVVVDGFGGLDPRIALRDAIGNLVGSDDGSSENLAFDDAQLNSVAIPVTGTYYLEIGAASGAGSYSANVYLSTPGQPPAPQPSSDYYRFDAVTGDHITLALKALRGAQPAFEIQNAAGETLATPSLDTRNFGAVIADFMADANGPLFIAVRGLSGEEYTLEILKNAGLDLEDNSELALAQPLPPSGIVQGALGAGSGGRLFAIAGDTFNQIVEFDPLTGEELNRIPLPEGASLGPDGLAFNGESLFFLNGFGSGQLWELNPDTGEVVDVDGAFIFSYDALAALNGLIYVSNYETNQIFEFDPVSDSVTRTISVVGFDLIGGLAGASDPDRLVATAGFGATIVEIDPETGAVTSSFSAAAIYGGLAVIGDEVYLGSLNGGPQIDVYSRAGEFQRTISLPFATSALGGDGGGGHDEDWYRFELLPGERLRLITETPGGGAGEFVNDLDPAVELYSSDGQLLRADDNGAADHRNAHLTFVNDAGGVYYVRVLAAGNRGEYVLHAQRDQEPIVPGDTDADGDVDLDDLNNVYNGFGGTGLGDTSPFDGDVDLDDLNAVRNQFAGNGEGLAGRNSRVVQRTATENTAAVDAVFGALAKPSSGDDGELFDLVSVPSWQQDRRLARARR